jgi:hypothetical protein
MSKKYKFKKTGPTEAIDSVNEIKASLTEEKLLLDISGELYEMPADKDAEKDKEWMVTIRLSKRLLKNGKTKPANYEQRVLISGIVNQLQKALKVTLYIDIDYYLDLIKELTIIDRQLYYRGNKIDMETDVVDVRALEDDDFIYAALKTDKGNCVVIKLNMEGEVLWRQEHWRWAKSDVYNDVYKNIPLFEFQKQLGQQAKEYPGLPIDDSFCHGIDGFPYVVWPWGDSIKIGAFQGEWCFSKKNGEFISYRNEPWM